MLSLKDQLLFNKAVFMYKILNNNLPSYLSNLFRPSLSRYSLHKQRLIIPKPRIDIYKTCIAYAGVSVWNSLPTNIRMQNTLPSFKIHFRRLLLTIQNDLIQSIVDIVPFELPLSYSLINYCDSDHDYNQDYVLLFYIILLLLLLLLCSLLCYYCYIISTIPILLYL